MICSPEQAKSTITGWGSEDREVRGVLADKGVRMGFTGRVSSVSGLTVVVFGNKESAERAELTFDLTDTTSEYGDKRELPESSFEAALSIRFPSGLCLFLAAR